MADNKSWKYFKRKLTTDDVEIIKKKQEKTQKVKRVERRKIFRWLDF